MWSQSVSLGYSVITCNLFWTFYLCQNLLCIFLFFYLFTDKIYIIRLKIKYCIFYLLHGMQISMYATLFYSIVFKYAALECRVRAELACKKFRYLARNLYFTCRPWTLYCIIWIIYICYRKYKKQTSNFVKSACCPSVTPSVCMCVFLRPHGTTGLPLDGFSWNLIFERFD